MRVPDTSPPAPGRRDWPSGAPTLVVFAKAPTPGVAKTRLIPALGAAGAAQLARQMLAHTLAQALASNAGPVELCMSPDPLADAWHGIALPDAVEGTAQGEGDLGQRMARAMNRVLDDGRPVLLMGTDGPELDAALLRKTAAQLTRHDAVLLPASDGGYLLIGLRAPCAAIFENMVWSTDTVAAETRRRLALDQRSVWVGPTLHDIDEPADLAHLPSKLNFFSDLCQ